ncbi:MAG TPA: DUF1015 domain-containing protein [Candidatus Acidoferrales bacterium]|nr:DUF1015 domain-containing protein [Candidatus Acidoferrales bacterium]
MAEIHPFRALRYDESRAPLASVLTQPYDKITPAMQDAYYAASPYNLIAIEKGRTLAADSAAQNVYTRAGKKVEEWIAGKILVRDAAPAIYVYSQQFTVPGSGAQRTRTGFIALGRVEDYDAQVVFRHERTLSAPKADRIELLRHTHVQTGQLFMLYDDPAASLDALLEDAMRRGAPAEMRDEYGVAHRLWAVSDAKFIGRIQAAMSRQKLVIADGHHRYETALHYRNERREHLGASDRFAAHEFAMMTFVNSHSSGLTILPTHRLIGGLAQFDFDKFRKQLASIFDWYSYPFTGAEERTASFAEFRKDLADRTKERRAIGIYPAGRAEGAGAFYLFVLRKDADLEQLLPDVSEAQRGLDVVLLHRLILERGLGITAEAVAAEKNVSYEREMEAAIGAADEGKAQLACLLHPVRVEQVMNIALGGDVLPQKSTDFYPKLLSGVAIYQVEGRVEAGEGDRRAGAINAG